MLRCFQIIRTMFRNQWIFQQSSPKSAVELMQRRKTLSTTLTSSSKTVRLTTVQKRMRRSFHLLNFAQRLSRGFMQRRWMIFEQVLVSIFPESDRRRLPRHNQHRKGLSSISPPFPRLHQGSLSLQVRSQMRLPDQHRPSHKGRRHRRSSMSLYPFTLPSLRSKKASLSVVQRKCLEGGKRLAGGCSVS